MKKAKYLNKITWACPKCGLIAAQRNIANPYCHCNVKLLCFDSQKEYDTWRYLVSAQDAGEIKCNSLEVHPRIELHFDLKYEADFGYFDGKELVLLDVKALKKKTGKPIIHNPELFFAKLRMLRGLGYRVEIWTAIDGSQVWKLSENGKKLEVVK